MPIVKGFRRFRSNILSFRQVVTEISSLVAGSNVQQSRWSSDAASTSKRKRITSADRRLLLEAFVNKYRAMNSGKFPTPTSAVKEVGGGYYYIKKMLQEMEYNSKISSMEKVPVEETKKQTKGEEEEDTARRKIAIESYTSQKKVSNSQIAMDQNLYEDAWLEASGNLDTNPRAKKGIQPSTSSGDTGNNNITRDDTHNIATQSHDDVRAQCHEKPEHHPKDETYLEAKDSDLKAQQHDDGIKTTIRDMPESQKDLELIEKPSSLSIWGNLKSLASGFINIWKKQ